MASIKSDHGMIGSGSTMWVGCYTVSSYSVRRRVVFDGSQQCSGELPYPPSYSRAMDEDRQADLENEHLRQLEYAVPRI